MESGPCSKASRSSLSYETSEKMTSQQRHTLSSSVFSGAPTGAAPRPPLPRLLTR